MESVETELGLESHGRREGGVSGKVEVCTSLDFRRGHGLSLECIAAAVVLGRA